jgi:Xaa-Pro aminopeptidase
LKATRLYQPRGGKGPPGVLDPGCILDEMRLFKDEEELDRIRRAAQITSESFCEMLEYCSPGSGEWELAAALEFGFRKRGASGNAYPTIVGSGKNSCVLHYSDNDRRMEEGDLVLVDGGAEVDLYAGDITRTFPVSGSFSKVQKEVYEVVQRSHECAINEISPGVALDSIHRVAVGQLVEGLLDLGVLEGSAEEIIDKKVYKKFFPHQTSHWLGLDVHDVGDYFDGDQSRILQPGMVLTVEPGLYFPSAAESIEEFFGIGIRIEDDLLVTANGSESLGALLPVVAEEVESLLKDRE